jgi:hypothetical protein
MRGSGVPLGTENKSANGYMYVKTSTGWRLKHHLIAEGMLGRPLNGERVSFKDGNRENFHPSNILVTKSNGNGKSKNSQLNKRLTTIEEKMVAYIEDSNDPAAAIRELRDIVDHLTYVHT